MEAEIEIDGKYISPFFSKNVAHIAYIEVLTGVSITITDLRLFVDHLDYKVVADITVANDQKFGHFTDIKKAVDYARKFTKMFPNMGTPSITVKEGEYEIKETVLIDFDLKFSGTGPQTIIKRGGLLAEGDEDKAARSPVFMIGGGEPGNEGSSPDLLSGTTFENFTYKMTPGFPGGYQGGTAFLVTQDISLPMSLHSKGTFFNFTNIRFIGQYLGVAERVGSFVEAAEPFEFAIMLGPEVNSGAVIGNVLITNCFFSWFGVGAGPCYLNNENEHKNIIASGNTALSVYGIIPGITSGDNHGILHIRPIADYTDVTGDGNKLTRIIDSGNISDDQE